MSTPWPHGAGEGSGLTIVHDQAADLGGNERVLQALLERYPSAAALAPHFTPTNRPAGYSAPWDRRSRLIGRGGRCKAFRTPLYARRVASAPIDGARVVLSITHGGWSLAARVPPGARHVCFSAGLPPHLYGHSHLPLQEEPVALRPLLAACLPVLRAYDRRLMRRPTRVIANSAFSARALERVHGRAAEVLHPPVRTDFFTPGQERPRHFLVVGRLVAVKRLDLAVDAFRGLDEQLVVAGGGPTLEDLRRRAPRNVRFVGPCDDEALRRLYRSSRALICPSVETFGVVMAESHATGTPVIAPRAGGALEIVNDRETGILLRTPDPRSIAEAVRAITAHPLDPRPCRASAERFSQGRFGEAMDHILRDELAAGGPDHVSSQRRKRRDWPMRSRVASY
jgi:glycosyltransferase involved in cell wall biosynthesis